MEYLAVFLLWNRIVLVFLSVSFGRFLFWLTTSYTKTRFISTALITVILSVQKASAAQLELRSVLKGTSLQNSHFLISNLQYYRITVGTSFEKPRSIMIKICRGTRKTTSAVVIANIAQLSSHADIVKSTPKSRPPRPPPITVVSDLTSCAGTKFILPAANSAFWLSECFSYF